ncbi:TPA: hypothetical protein TUD09_001529 [Streptococcus equi subsp. zooepidemicus]|uniref:Uncharacterized protein n=1 Tax=Streptococcus equi subsp. ruminatorum CECT 5772 TaxID=1051981 RepID=A0A922NUE9_9STRE|nr:hypothetical protein [Streptococcus equi]KED04384.1 hypothetical protein CECT5772_05683 [Streptococcus equi subsp. ruminatorum CECT 5772]HEL0247261.1 hypothetical protein [Streptococcus equi subsp. zooepidemicus]HEL1012535.1 hypothetical protein [Streptococcus equi subsp. ruminatorum]HEL1024600.1 hypothetical protein [Streptococcus equi subsp. ruminatorum CECT 5772]
MYPISKLTAAHGLKELARLGRVDSKSQARLASCCHNEEASFETPSASTEQLSLGRLAHLGLNQLE